MAEDYQVPYKDSQQLQAQLITKHFLLHNSWIFILLFPLDLVSKISLYKPPGTYHLYLQLLPTQPSWLPDGTLHFSPFSTPQIGSFIYYEGNTKEKMLLLPKNWQKHDKKSSPSFPHKLQQNTNLLLSRAFPKQQKNSSPLPPSRAPVCYTARTTTCYTS